MAGSLVVDNRRTLAASDRSRIQQCLIAEAKTARSRIQKDTWMKSGTPEAMGNALQAMKREDLTLDPLPACSALLLHATCKLHAS